MNSSHLAARLLLSPLRLLAVAVSLLPVGLSLLPLLLEMLALALVFLAVELVGLLRRLRHPSSTTTSETSPRPADSTSRTFLTVERLPNI